MSLILDALRKLERNKDAGEPGVVVVGSVPWGGGRSRRSPALVLLAAALLALAAGGWWLLRRAPVAPRPHGGCRPAPTRAARATRRPRPASTARRPGGGAPRSPERLPLR